MGNRNASRPSPSAAEGFFGGAFAGGMLGLMTYGATRQVAGEKVSVVAGGLIGVPSIVIGACLGGAAGGTIQLVSLADELRQRKGMTKAAISDSFASMEAKRDHVAKRGQTSSGVAQLPDEAGPYLIALAVATRARVISKDDAFARTSVFSVRCAMEELSPEEVLQEAEAAGREVLTFAKLREIFPEDSPEAVEWTARFLAREDPDACDAAWIVCGPKPLSEWSKRIRQAIPDTVADVSPDLLTRALQLKFKEVLPSLAQTLQQCFPGGSEHDYIAIVSRIYQKLPAATFWKLWQLLQDPPCAQDLDLSFEQLASPAFPEELQKALASRKYSAQENERTMKRFAPKPRQKDKNNEFGELRVDVLCAESLSGPEYRVGDMTSSLFGAVGFAGARTLKPYVEISWGGDTHQTRIVTTSNGSCDFGESFCFNLKDDVAAELSKRGSLQVRAFDAREAQSAIRGDPLFGEGSISMTQKMFVEGLVARAKLKRGGEGHGAISVRCRHRAPQKVIETLSQSKGKPLAQVVKGLAEVLRTGKGIDLLVDSRPPATQGVAKEVIRPMVEDWARQFISKADRLAAEASEKEAIDRLVNLGASVQTVVSACIAPGTGRLEMQSVAASWIHHFLTNAAAAMGAGTGPGLAKIDEQRLWNILKAGFAELKMAREPGPMMVISPTMAVVPPPYWNNLELAKADKKDMRIRTQELDGAFLKQLQRSCTHPRCSSFDINAVTSVRSYRLENPITWTQYRNKAAELAARHEADGVEFCPQLQPRVPECMYPEGVEIDESMNEVYLWHATKHNTVDTIINEGFDERVCNLGGLFGAGVYFAEESCKSGQYASKHQGTHFFFVSRVLLGRPYYATSHMQQTRRPPEGYDSIIANQNRFGHRELIVYDRFQAYPEFLVEAQT